MGTLVVDVVDVDEVEAVVRAAPGVQNPANQLCNDAKSAGEQAGQMDEGFADRGFNKPDKQKHDW